MNKPHCYGKMDWILKYQEDEMPSTSICSCNYTNSCLRITNNKREISQGEAKADNETDCFTCTLNEQNACDDCCRDWGEYEGD